MGPDSRILLWNSKSPDYMKARFALIGVLLLVAESVFGQGAAMIIKQRAKEIRDQNNVRQEVPTPAPAVQPAQPAAPAAPPRALTPQEQCLARIQSDLSAMKPEAQPSIPQKLALGKDLMAAVQGPAKPSQATVNKLARDIADVLGEKLLATVTVKRLVQDLNTILNPTAIGATQLSDVIADLQAIFQANNVDRKEAVAIAADAKATSDEIKKAAATPAP